MNKLDIGYLNGEKKFDLISLMGEVENNQNDISQQNLSFHDPDNMWNYH